MTFVRAKYAWGAHTHTIGRQSIMDEIKQLEQYHFYRLYSIDLDTTKGSLRILKRYRRKDVRYCLLRDIVVSYCRPFSGNKGEKILNHKLYEKFVPEEFRPIHKELVGLRNQLFAHTDYTFRQPKVVNWSRGSIKWFPMQFRGYDYAKLDRRISEIEKLVTIVEKNLQTKINKIQENSESPQHFLHQSANRERLYFSKQQVIGCATSQSSSVSK